MLKKIFEIIQHEKINYSDKEHKILESELNWLKNQKGITQAELSRLKIKENAVKPHTPTADDLKTDMKNSIFNQLTDEQAFTRYGEQFFREYENYHINN